MESFGIYEAKAKLSELVDLAAAGGEVLITRGRRPVARLVAVKEPEHERQARARAMNELLEFARSIKPRKRISWRKLIAAGRR